MAKLQAVMSIMNDTTLNSFPSVNGQITEQDIIRFLVEQSETFNNRKSSRLGANLNQFFNKGDESYSQTDALSQKSGMQQNDNPLKLCMRIWSGYTKFLRSQCNKDRVIDSIYFGQFFRKDAVDQGDDQEVPTYACIQDLRKNGNQYLEFKGLVNAENYDSIPTIIRGREAVSVSIKAIAQVCGATMEQVTNFLTKMKETAFQLCLVKKKLVDLNLSIGHLIFSPSLSVEFKSVNKNDQQPSSALENHDRARLKSREGRDNSIFNSAFQNRSKIDSLIKMEGEPKKDYTHLSDFLKNQIHRSAGPKQISGQHKQKQADDTISSISRKNKYNNALIERASEEVRSRKGANSQNGSRLAPSEVDAYSEKALSQTNSQGKLQNIQNLQSAFLLGKKSQSDAQSYTGSYRHKDVNPDTLSDQKSTIAQSIAAKSYLSNRLSRGQQSQGVKSIASLKDKRGQSGGGPRSYAGHPQEKDRVSQSVRSSLSQRVSVTGQGRRGGTISQTRKKSMDINQFGNDYSGYQTNTPGPNQGSQSMKGKKVIDPFSNEYAISKSHKEINDFYKTAEAHFKNNPNAQMNTANMKNLIGLALNRKQVSTNYHYSAYPYFLRSQGPYKVYDHATTKGQQYVANLQEINEQAHNRFVQECKKVKEVRDFEREQFGWQKQKQDIIAAHDEQLKKKNNITNLSFLAQQIQQNREVKDVTAEIEKQYYKPHFGPEETDDALDKDYERKLRMKHFIKTQLINQMNEKKDVVVDNFNQERKGDLQQLQTCQNIFVAEERAREAKLLKEKQDNKMIWETQMQDRQLRETMEKLFY